MPNRWIMYGLYLGFIAGYGVKATNLDQKIIGVLRTNREALMRRNAQIQVEETAKYFKAIDSSEVKSAT
jgi:hypothetical protein